MNQHIAQSETHNLVVTQVVPKPWLGTTLAMIFMFLTSCGQSTQAVQENKKQPPKHNHEKRETANKLGTETSPYLLAHAHNPVDWYPWGEEALTKAKKEGKPIFLSIGYSSCHWCHVMERESFMDAEIAKFMNENFICIKVDREERPDIDNIYMTSLHTYNRLSGSGGGGGWPLSMFLTPIGEPFVGGTYFPARDGDRGASTGFLTVIKGVNDVWSKQKDKIKRDAAMITKQTKLELEGAIPSKTATLDSGWTDLLLKQMKDSFDAEHGGFTDLKNPNRPKFPEPSNLFFLIDQIQSKPDDQTAKNMLVKTLDKMAKGGIWDHVGSGFHRYSVDRFWHIPHFEKMLYDNGQLATVYAEAHVLTGREDYRWIAEGICDFVIAELTAPEKAFYSALDADSEGEEGKFYVWTKDEVKATLTEEEFKLFAAAYGLENNPNFEGKHYAPQYKNSLTETAKKLNLKPSDLEAKLIPMRTKLMAIRSKRERPLTDTKILTSWNGLMIRGMADTGRILKKKGYIESAATAAKFILEKMVADDGRLYRTFASGKPKLNAYLNDYAFMIDGLLGLHSATKEKQWLDKAIELQEQQDKLFWDGKNGGYFFTSIGHEVLLARSKIISDGAQPAGNSVAAVNLINLSKLVDDPKQKANYTDRAKKTIASVSRILTARPRVSPRIIIAVRSLTENTKKE